LCGHLGSFALRPSPPSPYVCNALWACNQSCIGRTAPDCSIPPRMSRSGTTLTLLALHRSSSRKTPSHLRPSVSVPTSSCFRLTFLHFTHVHRRHEDPPIRPSNSCPHMKAEEMDPASAGDMPLGNRIPTTMEDVEPLSIDSGESWSGARCISQRTESNFVVSPHSQAKRRRTRCLSRPRSCLLRRSASTSFASAS